jgi:hypothetical protein
MSKTPDTLVVLGIDADGQPRAARFADADARLVIKAARALRYRAARVRGRKLLAALRTGDPFAQASGFAYPISAALFEQLDRVIAPVASDQASPASKKLAWVPATCGPLTPIAQPHDRACSVCPRPL